jgi:ribosomal protein S18 acetylase RimI-like enzyme
MPPKVLIRRMAPDEEGVCAPLWRRGFHEMMPSFYSKLLRSPAFYLFCAATTYSGYRLCAISGWWRLLGVPLLLLGAVLPIPPLGGRLMSALFWLSISSKPFLLKASDAVYFVALSQPSQSIVGCVCVKAQHTLSGEREAGVPVVAGEASVWRLTVDPSTRRLGVGKLLMQEAEQYAVARGCKAMTLVTGNDASKKFYLDIGYQQERSDRALRVLFPASQPTTLLGRVRAHLLPGRLSSTVLVKHLS